MAVELPPKWVQTDANGRTIDAAAFALKTRLDAVAELLPLAAAKADEDPAFVHRLRVWTRRSGAALELYDELLPRRRRRWMKKQLKRIRHAANDARDCDVLIERLTKEKKSDTLKLWLKEARAERAKAQKAVVKIDRRLGRDHRLKRRIDKLVKRTRAGGKRREGASVSFDDWSRERLPRFVEQFFAAIPTDETDTAAMHRFRVRGKELRYAIELLAGAYPERLRTSLYPVIEAMLDRLGAINDLATSASRLRQKLTDSHDERARFWQRMLSGERARLQRAVKTFWSDYTPVMFEELRERLEAVLGDELGRGR
jgi:CHAD domain-containing protein